MKGFFNVMLGGALSLLSADGFGMRPAPVLDGGLFITGVRPVSIPGNAQAREPAHGRSKENGVTTLRASSSSDSPSAGTPKKEEPVPMKQAMRDWMDTSLDLAYFDKSEMYICHDPTLAGVLSMFWSMIADVEREKSDAVARGNRGFNVHRLVFLDSCAELDYYHTMRQTVSGSLSATIFLS
ncbi:unnamed protein product [Discosporangium mesarthrocarpum]